MSEESAPAPSQGIGAWIVSGSVALVMVIGGAAAFTSPDKRTEEGNPTSNQTVAPGGGHTTGPSRDSAAPPVPNSTEARGAASVLGIQLTMPGTTDRDAGDTARAPRERSTATPVLPARNPSGNLTSGVGGQSAPTRLNGLALAADESAPATLNPDEAAPIIETPDAPDQLPALSEPDLETEIRGGAPVPSVPGTHSLTWRENGQQFSARVNVGQDGQVTVIDADDTPERYRYDPANGRLTATVTPGTGTDQYNGNDPDADTAASGQLSADPVSSEATSVETADSATTAPLATIASTRPSTQVGNSAERAQRNSTGASATPIRATQILTNDFETEQPRGVVTEAEEPPAKVTAAQPPQVDPTETKRPPAVVHLRRSLNTPDFSPETKQPHVQATRTRPSQSQSQSQSQAQPTETAPRSADATPDAGSATPTTSTSPAPAA